MPEEEKNDPSKSTGKQSRAGDPAGTSGADETLDETLKVTQDPETFVHSQATPPAEQTESQKLRAFKNSKDWMPAEQRGYHGAVPAMPDSEGMGGQVQPGADPGSGMPGLGGQVQPGAGPGSGMPGLGGPAQTAPQQAGEQNAGYQGGFDAFRSGNTSPGTASMPDAGVMAQQPQFTNPHHHGFFDTGQQKPVAQPQPNQVQSAQAAFFNSDDKPQMIPLQDPQYQYGISQPYAQSPHTHSQTPEAAPGFTSGAASGAAPGSASGFTHDLPPQPQLDANGYAPMRNTPIFADRPQQIHSDPEPGQSDEDDDDDQENDDDELDESPSGNRFKRLDKLVTPDTKGLLIYNFHLAKEVAFNSKEFFSALPKSGNIAEPGIYLAIMCVAGGLLCGITQMNLLMTIAFVFVNIIVTVLTAYAYMKLFTLSGSTSTFEQNFRVIAYSQVTLIIAGIHAGILSFLTGIIAFGLSIFIQLQGMELLHDMPRNKILTVLIGVSLFFAVIHIRLGV